jgi:F-box and leucine-rich repeat protein GRR1
MYKLQTSSATSLSDYDEDDDDKTIFSSSHRSSPTVVPAKWSAKLRPIPKRSSKRAPIANLPPEVLIHILKHLHSTRDVINSLRVSRTWCECSVELLWHKPAFPRYETVQKMARLLAKPTQTFTYARFIRRLNFLNLGTHLTDDAFSAFARCDRLERLTLVGCEHISGDALTRILPCFSNLVAVDLTGVVGTTNHAIIGLALSARRLQGINLAGCGKVSDEGIMALAENCLFLRRVKLSGLETLTDEPISLLAKQCPLLLEIDLNQCELITDIAIRDIWTHSVHMREMRLSHCPLLTDSAFPACARSEAILSPDAPDPFPWSTMNHADLPPLILTRQMEHMRMLDLTACALITDDAIEGIISHSPKIRNLVLSKCVLLTDRTVENICRLGRHLHYLHLGHAAKITDRSVRILARSCTRLRYVDFASKSATCTFLCL